MLILKEAGRLAQAAMGLYGWAGASPLEYAWIGTLTPASFPFTGSYASEHHRPEIIKESHFF